ncbi:MAG: hypothetical protein IPJ76_00475 [Flavobacteriales bacterium]|nr:MAG: hypothetical protein IPJ76_00475 [Flavobacteriales bacterium]
MKTHVTMNSCGHVAIGRHVLRFALLLGAHGLMATWAHAQSPGTLRLFIDPGHEFVFVLDGKHKMQQREVTLPGGPHRFQFWAPTRRIVDTTLAVFPDRTVDFKLRLPFSTEYLDYQLRMDEFRKNRMLNRALPLGLTGISAVVSAVYFSKYKKTHDQLQEDVDQYRTLTSPGAITQLKEETMPAHQDDFDKAERNFFISLGVTGALAVASTYLYVKSSKLQVPVFEDKERIKFNGLAWVPDGRGGYWAGGLTINLAAR